MKPLFFVTLFTFFLFSIFLSVNVFAGVVTSLDCFAHFEDSDGDSLLVSYAWYNVTPTGALVYLSDNRVLEVTDIDTSIYVCEVLATDGEDLSFSYKKPHTNSAHSLYIPFGSIEASIQQIGDYSGRENIPKYVVVKKGQPFAYEVSASCIGGTCGKYFLNLLYDPSNLVETYNDSLLKTLYLRDSSSLQFNISSQISSDNSAVNTATLDPYYLTYDDSTPYSDYYVSLNSYAVITYTDGSSIVKGKVFKVTSNVSNITFYSTLIVEDKFHLFPPFEQSIEQSVQIVSNDSSVLNTIGSTNNVFGIYGRGTAEVLLIPDFEALLSDLSYEVRKPKDVFTVIVDLPFCPLSLTLRSNNLSLNYNVVNATNLKTDIEFEVETLLENRSISSNDLDYIEGSWDSSHFYSAYSAFDSGNAFDVTSLISSMFDINYESSSDNFYLKTLSSFNKTQWNASFENMSQYPVDFIYNVSYAVPGCAVVFDDFVLHLDNLTETICEGDSCDTECDPEIDPGCNDSNPDPDLDVVTCTYALDKTSKTIYWKSYEPLSVDVIETCRKNDGTVVSQSYLPPHNVSLDLISGVDANVKYYAANVHSKTCIPSQELLVNTTACYRIVHSGVYVFNVYVGDILLNTPYVVRTECGFDDDTLTITSPDFSANVNSVQSIMINETFEISEVLITNVSSGHDINLLNAYPDYLSFFSESNKVSLHLNNSVLNGIVQACSEPESITDLITVSYNASAISFCNDALVSQSEFYLPAPSIRATTCDDYDVILEKFVNNFLYDNEAFSGFYDYSSDITLYSSLVLNNKSYIRNLTHLFDAFSKRSSRADSREEINLVLDSVLDLPLNSDIDLAVLKLSNTIYDLDSIKDYKDRYQPFSLFRSFAKHEGDSDINSLKKSFDSNMSVLLYDFIYSYCDNAVSRDRYDTIVFSSLTNSNENSEQNGDDDLGSEDQTLSTIRTGIVQLCTKAVLRTTFNVGVYFDSNGETSTEFCEVDLDYLDSACCERNSCIYDGVCYPPSNKAGLPSNYYPLDIDGDGLGEYCVGDS